MRDLQKDLEEWITDHDIGAHGEWFYMIGEYIERAIKAEAEIEQLQTENAKLRKVAEVERYKLMVKSITGGLDETIETVYYLEKIIDGLNVDLRIVATIERSLSDVD